MDMLFHIWLIGFAFGAAYHSIIEIPQRKTRWAKRFFIGLAIVSFGIGLNSVVAVIREIAN